MHGSIRRFIDKEKEREGEESFIVGGIIRSFLILDERLVCLPIAAGCIP